MAERDPIAKVAKAPSRQGERTGRREGGKTEIAGLPVATAVPFPFRATTKTGAGDWSQAISLLVK
jgi:hypothetical protein